MTKKKNKKVTDVEEVKPPRKIAMCGTAPSTRGLIPWETDWEVWGQADCTGDAKNPSRWFDIAPIKRIVDEFPEYHEWQKRIDFPIFMRQHHDFIPTSQAFPFDQVGNRYGMEFMTATLTWMMGLACWEHELGNTVGTIGLFGYDMALDSEYAFQRPGIKHMEWICREHMPALGHPKIDVIIPMASDLAHQIIPYPFADDNADVAKIRARKQDIINRQNHLGNRKAQLVKKLREVDDDLIFINGAMEDVNYWERSKVGHHNPAH